MNKKEISEIKKQFTPANCSIDRICGCYVDGDKNKKTEVKEAFLSLSEEEMFKYFDIFKKTLSGTLGKNLMNMEFPLEQEADGGTQEFLMRLRASRLTAAPTFPDSWIIPKMPNSSTVPSSMNFLAVPLPFPPADSVIPLTPS